MTRRLLRRAVDRAAVRFGIDEDRSHEATDERLRARFIANGRESKYGDAVRRQICERFDAVHALVTAATSPTDALHLAEAVLSIDAAGDRRVQLLPGRQKVLQVLTDHQLWTECLREPVPIVYGAGYGPGDTSRMLGFMLRGADLDYEYIKGLTIQK